MITSVTLQCEFVSHISLSIISPYVGHGNLNFENWDRVELYGMCRNLASLKDKA